MIDELKACPFCGKSDIHIEQKGTFFWCECYDCGAISREHHTLPGVNVLQSENIARGYWNQRPLEDALHARIAELEATQRWIPVSEPPKIDGTYLLRNIYDDVYSCDFIANTNTWVLSEYDSITHWMPLPKLPEVQE